MGHGSPSVSQGCRGISRWHSWSPKPHLLGSLPDQFKYRTGCRRRIGELQFFRREGGDNSFLIRPSDHVRERTSLNFGGDDLIRLVDEYVPKYAIDPCTTALYSSGVPRSRLLDANL